MGHKRQVIRFGIVLNCCALILFALALITKLHALTFFGFLLLFSAVYIQYIYLPQLKKKKKEQKLVLEEVHPHEVFDLGDQIKICWDKFIVWLHT
jgi:hypothetical protein